MSSPVRRTLAAVLLATSIAHVGPPAPASAAPTGSPPGSPTATGSELAVTAWALPSATPRLIRRNAAGLDTVTVVGASLVRGGRGVSLPDAQVTRLATAAHRQGRRAELLVGNWSNRLGDFDPEAVRRLLQHPRLIRRVADRLAGAVATGDWDGVNVDLERLGRRDGRGLVRLLRALRSRLPDTATLTVDISASGTLASYRDRGYRLGDIAATVDRVQLMTYDQHGPGWSGPGPVGALAWQRACLETALSRVPADQLDLGVAGYGYLWRRDGGGRSVTVAGARRLVERAGATARWRREEGEWTARLGNGRRLWWSDGRSYALRRDLASELGLHGVAVWRLGSADTLEAPPASR